MDRQGIDSPDSTYTHTLRIPTYPCVSALSTLEFSLKTFQGKTSAQSCLMAIRQREREGQGVGAGAADYRKVCNNNETAQMLQGLNCNSPLSHYTKCVDSTCAGREREGEIEERESEREAATHSQSCPSACLPRASQRDDNQCSSRGSNRGSRGRGSDSILRSIICSLWASFLGSLAEQS